MPELTVAENLMLGAMPNRSAVHERERAGEAREAKLDRSAKDRSRRRSRKHLSIGQRQMIEIGKALMRNARVIAFDEPTSSLSSRETEQLFKIIRTLHAEGRAIIYVTHRMDEIYALCDRVTVFRDGRRIETFEERRRARRDRLISCMVGRSIRDVYGYRARDIGDVQLGVKGLRGRGSRNRQSFDAKRARSSASSGSSARGARN